MLMALDSLNAFAPTLVDAASWRSWSNLEVPVVPEGDDKPPLPQLPAMQRRRLDLAGRMALHVAWECQSDPEPDVPQVFASRHGDVGRTYRMLEQLAVDGSVSPTQFGLSTHNAVAAQYSIARRFTGNYSAISAGSATPEAAVAEAQGLLADGAPAVLLVVYEVPLAQGYAQFDSEPQAAFAWAARLVRSAGGAGLRLTAEEAAEAVDGGAEPPGLPHGLEVLRYLMSDTRELTHRSGDTLWRWQRD